MNKGKVEFDYSKLIGRIAEMGYTHKRLAIEAGITPTTFGKKLNNKSTFDAPEIVNICYILGLSPENDANRYFFTLKVKENLN